MHQTLNGPAAEGQPGQKKSTTFRRLLISKLQDEFENQTRNVDVYGKGENPLLPEEEEQRAIAKIKMLGNIKFIGELGKLDLIHESILHKCIKTVSNDCEFKLSLITTYIIFGRYESITILPSETWCAS